VCVCVGQQCTAASRLFSEPRFPCLPTLTRVPARLRTAGTSILLNPQTQESINIWWINDALVAAGLSPFHSTPCHPVSEATFNFVLAWAALFLPVLLTDGPSQKVQNKVRAARCAFER
jgi:hypothetical protein